MRLSRLGGATALVVLWSDTASAQGPSIKPVRILTPPAIDGRLDDASWTGAAQITQFVQRRPLDGAPASERTDVYIAYDSDRLYFGIRAYYSEPSLVRANRVDRDQIWNDDRVSVIFDPFRDQQRGYRFAINAYGVQGDALVASGGSGAAAAASASGRRSVVERAVRVGRHVDHRWMDGGVRRPVQEPALSRARCRRSAPVGPADRRHAQRRDEFDVKILRSHRHGDQINPTLFPRETFRRTNRAVFTKLQYLFRYQS